MNWVRVTNVPRGGHWQTSEFSNHGVSLTACNKKVTPAVPTAAKYCALLKKDQTIQFISPSPAKCMFLLNEPLHNRGHVLIIGMSRRLLFQII